LKLEKFQKVAIIGAGPSLDYCFSELRALAHEGALFLISDSIAVGLIRVLKLEPQQTIIFTVEKRRHGYLLRDHKLKNFQIAAYAQCDQRNLPNGKILRFTLAHEKNTDEIILHSPGTVAGVMLSFAKSKMRGARELYLFGCDFSYPENQVYSRLVTPHWRCNDHRLFNNITHQYLATLRKSSALQIVNGYAIKSTFEFMQSAENWKSLLDQFSPRVALYDYSPLGIRHERVQKLSPNYSLS